MSRQRPSKSQSLYSLEQSLSAEPFDSRKPPDLWLCLRFEQLALDALREQGNALDFVHQQHRLLAVTDSARELGLNPGMSVNQALMIAPAARGVEREPEREQQQLQTLAHWAYRYTPQVTIKDECLLLEVGHCLKLFRGFRVLYGLIEEDLYRFAIQVKPGVAHTALAAQVLSFALNNGVQVASENNTEPDCYLQLLAQAGIETLAISERVSQQLQACGFETLEDLLIASRSEIGQRFGRELLDYLARLLGEKDDPQTVIVPPEPFLLVKDFAEPIHNHLWITECTDDMLQAFCTFLRQRQLLCQLLLWRFYSDKTLIEQLSIPLSSKHYSFETFKRLTDLHMEKLKLAGELMRIELFSDRLLPAQLLVDDFFDPRIKEHEASELIDKLSTRLGNEAVYQIRCVAEPVPELSMVRSPFAAPYVASSRKASVDDTFDQASKNEYQPCWLLLSPQPLSFHRDEPMQPLDHRQRPMQLVQGPDRMDSHWWSRSLADGRQEGLLAGGQHRDYYIARQWNGRLLWVFFDRLDKGWFLQGVFG